MGLLTYATQNVPDADRHPPAALRTKPYTLNPNQNPATQGLVCQLEEAAQKEGGNCKGFAAVVNFNGLGLRVSRV